MFKALLSLFVISILTGCASADFGSPNTYQRYDVQRIGQMEQATVIRVRAITIESNSDSSGLSSIVSSVAGAFLGSQVIGNGRRPAAATSQVHCRVRPRVLLPSA
jgi:outer membrane lipoprotein SlyB